MFTPNKIKSRFLAILFQIIAVILFLDILVTPKPIINEDEPQLAFWNFVVQVVIMIALSMLLAPKPKKPPKPVGLESFNIPTAEEGKPIQVLFGKKYIASPNVVWYGHLKSQAITAGSKSSELGL